MALSNKSDIVEVISPDEESKGLYVDGKLLATTWDYNKPADVINLFIKHQVSPKTFIQKNLDEDFFNAWLHEWAFPELLTECKFEQ